MVEITEAQQKILDEAEAAHEKLRQERRLKVSADVALKMETGWVTNGFRIHDPRDSEQGALVLLEPEEIHEVMHFVAKILRART